MNFSGFAEAFARPEIGSVEVLEAKCRRREHRLGLFRHLRLQLALLEHASTIRSQRRDLHVAWP